MKIGDRVKVIYGREYEGQLAGETGMVKLLSEKVADKAGIRFPNRANLFSASGVFWINKNNLEIIESEESIMPENYEVVIVELLNDKKQNNRIPYALYDRDIGYGRWVVVKTGHHGFAVAQIVEILPMGSRTVEYGREVVAPVDLNPYYNRQERRKGLAELKRSMDAKVKELQSTALYEMLAEKDPELADMLHRYKNLMQKEQV